ncbi:hypothetical protein ACH41E_30125 [Streptomyces sp. NPDC020412]|uniref:hypothetical protein n=1 Tax=Streptomyces sp. NPDC020412 TaxID=3365073 RepID=UPI0037B9A764
MTPDQRAPAAAELDLDADTGLPLREIAASHLAVIDGVMALDLRTAAQGMREADRPPH